MSSIPIVSTVLMVFFYWYRLWLNLDGDLRTEIDEQQAVVDGIVYVSFVLYFIGLLFAAYSVLQAALGIQFVSQLSSSKLLLIGLSSLLAGYALYRLSLQAVWNFGNYFKAMFDCFYTKYDPKPVLEMIAKETEEDNVKHQTGSDAYRTAWRYLRWHEFRSRDKQFNINFETAKKRDRVKG